MLADVLGRLQPRSIAASRCVCTAWRAVIDGRRLLRADLLPLSLAGVFVNYLSDVGWGFAEFFSPPCAPTKLVSGCFPCAPHSRVEDHCNGLLLLHYKGGVLNPATGWRTALPERPRPAQQAVTECFPQDEYLVFDPTVSSSPSSHFEVFLVPRVPVAFGSRHEYRDDFMVPQRDTAALLGTQWPLSPCILNVFSSATGRWEERSFHRDGEGAGTVADMQIDAGRPRLFMRRRNAVYFRGALYVHSECDFVMRIALSTDKYSMIKPPPTPTCEFLELHLGKSENGIYFALLGDEAQLWVWILAETDGGQAEWILRHRTGAGLLLPSLNCTERFHHAPWILHHVTGDKDDDQNALAEHDEYGWNSAVDEEEIILDNKDNDGQTDWSPYLQILAFHPFKEILFLHRSMRRGLAYHLNSSKLEDLGDLSLGDLSPDMPFMEQIGTCFPYTPCWM